MRVTTPIARRKSPCPQSVNVAACALWDASTSSQKLKVLLGRHGTEPRYDIVLHGKLAEERNARRLRTGAKHFIRREAGQAHCLIEGVFQCGSGKPGPEFVRLAIGTLQSAGAFSRRTQSSAPSRTIKGVALSIPRD
jgi:hypothetical protein